jgi:hypothetical protein
MDRMPHANLICAHLLLFCLRVMNALGEWPQYASGMPITLTSDTAGCS